MLTLQLIRDEVMDDGVYGHIDVIGDRDSFRLGSIENLNYLIPPGKYPLKHTWSPKFQKFMAQKDLANGKKTLKAWYWMVCGEEYDAQHS